MAKTVKKNESKKKTCTCCGKEKEETQFTVSYSFQNRKTRRLSMCKQCCGDWYDRELLKYQNQKTALYRVCMALDLPFDNKLVEKTIDSLKSSNGNNNLMTMYMNRLGLAKYKDKTFSDDIQFINIFGLNEEDLANMMYLNAEKVKEELMNENRKKVTQEMILRWGDDLSIDDYMFLEDRYNVMLRTYEDKNPANLWTYQELCMNYLYLRKNRGNPTAVKQIQEMISKLQGDCKMKQSQIDGSDDEEACMGKYTDRIENYEPCDIALPFFRDVDRVMVYIKRFFTQPFAREHGIPYSDIEGLDGVEDYQDINKIYEEAEKQAQKDKEERGKNRGDNNE